MTPSEDRYLVEQLQKLERLAAEQPNTPEARTARRLVRRVRTYQTRGLLQNAPRTRRYVLGDIRAVTRQLETENRRGRDPPP